MARKHGGVGRGARRKADGGARSRGKGPGDRSDGTGRRGGASGGAKPAAAGLNGASRAPAGDGGAPSLEDDLRVIGLADDHPCVDCAACCRYVALEIDTPTTMTEYDYLVWYLVHPGVSVFVDWEGDWFVKFETRCEHLQPNGMCGIYETRPVICREFDWRDCEKHVTDEPPDRWTFQTADEFLAWFARQRPKTYQKFVEFQRGHRRKRGDRALRRVRFGTMPPAP